MILHDVSFVESMVLPVAIVLIQVVAFGEEFSYFLSARCLACVIFQSLRTFLDEQKK
jgi:hypothetical protein